MGDAEQNRTLVIWSGAKMQLNLIGSREGKGPGVIPRRETKV
jgi:hypothetical protein